MTRRAQILIISVLFAILAFRFWVKKSWNPPTDHAQAMTVDFCWLLSNPNAIGTRLFITSATMTSSSPHGSILESPSCPDRGVPFAERLVSQDHNSELEAKFRKNPYGSVRVSFEGTLYRPSVLNRL